MPENNSQNKHPDQVCEDVKAKEAPKPTKADKTNKTNRAVLLPIVEPMRKDRSVLRLG